MTIVSISRGSNSRGAEVAEKVAQLLGYRCLAREAMLEASGQYDIPEEELLRAIEQPPSILERTLDGKDRYLTTIRAALLKQFRNDNIVYHGFAGHYFVRDIKGALKVRILAELSDRVATVVKRNQLSEPEAERQLRKKDRARRRWGLYLYGVDPEDPSLYDIVLHVGKMGTDGAAEIICNLAQHDSFHTTEVSVAKLRDLSLAASMKAALLDMELDLDIVDITAANGEVWISFREPSFTRASPSSSFRERYLECLEQQVHERTHRIEGLKQITLKICTE